MSNQFVFDIETAPLPADQLHIPDFDPAEVKVGNLGPEKAQQKVEAAAKAHRTDYVARAALSPMSGRVVAIGLMECQDRVFTLLPNPDLPDMGEADMIRSFWHIWSTNMQADWIGHNIKGFDLPFLLKRSMRLGVSWPSNVRKGRYWGDGVIDTMEEWKMGNYRDSNTSLNNLARFFGMSGKNGSGADFYLKWVSDREAAIDYLRNDLDMTMTVAQRMGLVRQPFDPNAVPKALGKAVCA